MTAACPSCGAPLPAQRLEVRDVGIVLAPPSQESEGLMAWARIRLGPLIVSGLAVRRTGAGAITVTYPARKDQRGTLHREVTVADPDLDRLIRVAVIAEYLEQRRRAGRARP